MFNVGIVWFKSWFKKWFYCMSMCVYLSSGVIVIVVVSFVEISLGSGRGLDGVWRLILRGELKSFS